MKPYPRYEDSGVEWIGEVPEGWKIKRLKYHAKICNGHDHKKVWDENGEYPIIGTGGIFGRANDYLHPGPSVILGRKGTIDKPQFHENAFWSVDTAYYTDIFPNTNPKFFFYLCSTINFDLYKYGSAVPSMTQEVLNQIELTAPPVSEQTAIAAFLDRKTAEIDTLIANKERLIELYEEEKKAVINQAVTKGLDPDAEMKDSGVEWLGKIPAHWNVSTLRRHILSLDQGWSPKADSSPAGGDQWGVLKLSAVKKGLFNPLENKALENLPDNVTPLSPSDGDVLISRANTPDLVGDVCLVSGEHSWRIIPDLIYRLQLNQKKILSQYLVFFLLCRSGRNQIQLDARGSNESMVKIGKTHLKAWIIPLPSKAEQTAIVHHIETQCSRIDAIINKLKKQINLFKEYRTALISEAVTGKIQIK